MTVAEKRIYGKWLHIGNLGLRPGRVWTRQFSRPIVTFPNGRVALYKGECMVSRLT